METDYVYNALDNLLSVAQCSGSCPSTGTVGRSFTYDSLSRLVTATNPESGTVTYNYDANGNLSSKTSPAVNATSGTQTIGYCYDALNRMTYKFYSGSFSCTNSTGYAASYAYDTSTISGAGNVVGRLTDEQQYIGGTLVAERSPYQFTATGQLTREQQAPYSPNSTSYQFLYGYDLAGNQTCANNGFASVNSSSTCSNFTAIGSTIAEQFSYNGAGWLSNASVTLLPSLFTPSSAYPSTLLQASSSIPTNYDAMGHLVNAQLGVGSITAVQMVRQYDKRGRILSESDNNGSLYSYQVPAGTTGYRKNGNLGSFSDSVMGSWTFNYDTLNRLTTAQNTAVTSVSPQFAGIYGCWTYDAFGNRTSEAMSTTACSSNPTSASWAQYNGTGNGTNNNQMSATSQNLNQGNWYDAAGDVRFDGVNSYLYDTEGRVCAVSYTVAGTTIMTGYLYDASGTRVGKGSLQSWPSSCSALISGGGFVSTNQYLLGQGGEQVAELNGSGTILHSNVFTGGRLLATYNFTGSLGVHFALTDGLGTKRVQVSGTGASELSCLSLPFGNNIGNTPSTNCVGAGADATEQHFTGKERDTESGNDYFGARYYSSAMGRFMSPDWNESPVAIPYADLSNP
ncbi:MAG: RHS repeat-associated core domain-containing protein, partial [Anaerolineaceae bacterium]|nr:RHS repeat-associated core domain-containing protein [Anaerolineaceae bacterium]